MFKQLKQRDLKKYQNTQIKMSRDENDHLWEEADPGIITFRENVVKSASVFEVMV